jgi:DNA-binding response OmpR family regulator
MTAVLVVEDDERIGELLVSALKANGHEPAWQRTGSGALASAAGSVYDLVLLDLELPDIDGVDVCRTLKASQPGCVLVMLTARTDEMDVIVGLESGADDYLFKPFRMTELLARVRAHLRRVPAPLSATPLVVGDLFVDRRTRRCYVADAEVSLRPKEFDLLARLAESADMAVSRKDLMAEVWDEHWFGSTKTLDVHVAALRRQLALADERSGRALSLPMITTLRGYGYRLDSPPV